MLKVLSYILCDLDPKVKVIGQKAGICHGVPSTSALVYVCFCYAVLSVPGSLVITCWERADLLALLCFCHFPIWYPGSNVVLDCINF